MVWKCLIFFNICLSVNCLLLNPQKPCVPTATVTGPCHLCVCDTQGVFRCHSTICLNKTKVNPRISTKDECQAQMTYRYDDLFCICSYSNKWMSYNCRETFQFLKPNKTHVNHPLRSNISCMNASLILIDCNICKCDSSGFIQQTSCTNRLCSQTNKAQRCKFGEFLRTKEEICLCSHIGYFIDRLCGRVQEKNVQEINATVIAKITKIQKTKKAMDTEVCHPRQQYTVDCNRCICDETKKLVCSDKACDQGANLTKLRFKNLPEIQDGQSCISGKIYKNFCNTCRCGKNNSLICTKMACLEHTILNQIHNPKQSLLTTMKKQKILGYKNILENHNHNIMRSKLKNTGKGLPNLRNVPKGKCIPGKSYSSGCKKCFCTHEKVPICSKHCRKDTLMTKRLYEEDIIELDLPILLELPTLPHMGAECIPGKSYYVICNLCLCSDRKDLYCTMKYCANLQSYSAEEALKRFEGKPCDKDYSRQCVSCECKDKISSCKVIKDCNKLLSGKQVVTYGNSTIKLALDVKKDKCHPNISYKSHCNDCYCQADGGLRCTQKVCLTYSQIKDLQKREAYLEKHGL